MVDDYAATGWPSPSLAEEDAAREYAERAAVWEREGFEPSFVPGLTWARMLELGDIQFRSWWGFDRFPVVKDGDGRIRHAAESGRLLTEEDAADLAAMNARDFPDAPEAPRDEAADRAAMAAAGVPRRFAELALSGVALPERLEAWASDAAKGSAPWFYVGGGTGAGKTTLAGAACLAMVRRGARPRFVNARMLKQEWDAGGLYGTASRPTKAEAIEPYKAAPVLVLDGLGEERTDKAFCDCLFDLIDRRYTELRPTLITSQFGMSDYRNRMERAGGDREAAYAVASRVAGAMGGLAGCADNLLVLDCADRRQT